MEYKFTGEDIDSITKVLMAEPVRYEKAWSWQLNNPEYKQSLIMIIYNEAELGSGRYGSLVSVQTQHGYFELHGCSGFLIFEPDEVIFILDKEERVSSLIIGRNCTCSMYSNIDKHILHADFSTLDPAVLLSAMQLSITEAVIAG